MKTNLIKKLYLSLLVVALTFFSAAFVSMGYSSAKAADDSSKITISIDTLSYDEYYLPNGVVGKTYPVFYCSAFDGAGNELTDIDVLVYNPNNELVPITNNRFSTEDAGLYMIIYKVTNGINESTASLRVKVVDTSNYTPPYYTFNSSIVTSSNTGVQVALYDGEYGGGNGDLTLTSQIEYAGDYAPSNLAIENFGLYDYFIPTVAGTYTVTYKVTDIVGTEVIESKIITITDSLKPIIGSPSVQASALVGELMSLPNAEAVVYASGKQVYVPVKVYVNATDVTASMSYTPEDKGTITIKYEATNDLVSGGETAVYEQTVTVVDQADTASLPYMVNNFALNNLDASYRTTVSGTEQNEVFLLKAKNEGEVNAQFRLAVPAGLARMNFGLDSLTSTDTVISFSLIDSYDAEKVITVTLKVNADDNSKTDVYVAGAFIATVEKNLVTPDNYDQSSFDFVIDGKTNLLTEKVSGTEICEVTTYDNGKKFVGFDSGEVYMALSADNADANFAIKVYQICEQSLSSSTTDVGNPIFNVSADFATSRRVEYLSNIIVEPISAVDLFAKEVVVSVSITAPDRKEIYYNQNFTSIYTFKIEQYGGYTVTYEAVDSNGNFRQLVCYLNVIDRTAPIIEAPEIPETVKVGETLELPEIVVTDNMGDKQIVSWIYVTYGNYSRVTVIDGTYTFNEAGTYLIKYGAEDGAGNLTVLTFTVVCE